MSHRPNGPRWRAFPLDPEGIRRRSGLAVPPLATSLHYSARIRTEAVVRLGVYNVMGTLKRWFRRAGSAEGEGARHALEDSLRRIRRETERSVVFHMSNYRENLKYQYMFKLVDLMSNTLYDGIRDRFRVLTADLSDIERLADQEKDVKEASLQALAGLEASSRELLRRLGDLRVKMTSS